MKKESYKVILDKIPANIEPKFFQMNPQTDDLLAGGADLEYGMVVLIESANKREFIESDPEAMNETNRYYALEKNRWCMVTEVSHKDGHTYFIGLYHDGTKRQRVTFTTMAWYVKKDSKPWRPPYYCRPEIPAQPRALDI